MPSTFVNWAIAILAVALLMSLQTGDLLLWLPILLALWVASLVEWGSR